MIPFVLTPAAAEDIRDIDDRLAEDSKGAAERVSEAIEAAMARLAEHPMLGHGTPQDLAQPLRRTGSTDLAGTTDAVKQGDVVWTP